MSNNQLTLNNVSCISEYTAWSTRLLCQEYYEEHYFRANDEVEAFIDLWVATEVK